MKILCSLKKNIFFVIIAIIVCLSFTKRYTYLDASVVSFPDSNLTITTNNSTFQQTWQSYAKRIEKVEIPYSVITPFSAMVSLSIIDTADGQVIFEQMKKNVFDENSDNISFNTDNLCVTLGNQYILKVALEDKSEYGEIKIPVGNDYYGAQIDESTQECAFAINIEIAKYSKLFWLVLTILPIMMLSFFLMCLFNRSFEDVVAISVIGITGILYATGLIGKLESGIWIVESLAIILFVIGVILYNRKSYTWKDMISGGLIVYLCLTGIIILICKNYWMARWDEYTHWGLAVKDMFYYDSLSNHVNTTVQLIRYLPFSTLAEYFFMYANGVFSEGILYIAFLVLLLSALCVLLKTEKTKKLQLVLLLSGILIIPMVFFQDIYNCLYVDGLLAAWFAYILYCYFSEDLSKFNIMRIALGLFALTMTKDIGIVIAEIAVVIIAADLLLMKNKTIPKYKQGIMIMVMFLIPLISFASWQVYTSKAPQKVEQIRDVEDASMEDVSRTNNVTTMQASNISLEGIKDLLCGDAPSYRYKTIKNYLVALMDEDTYGFGNIKASYFDILVIIVIITIISFYLDRRKKRMVYTSILLLLGGMAYALFLLIAYLFAFGVSEAMSLASHERYFASYLCGVVILLFAKFVSEYEDRNERRKRTVGCVVLGILLVIVPINNLIVTNMDISFTKDTTFGFDKLQEMERSFGKKGDNVYFVCNNSTGGSCWMFRNTCSPMRVSSQNYNIYGSEEEWEKQKERYAEQGIEIKSEPRIISETEWKENISQCQYVYLMNIDEGFINSYGSLFENPNDITNASYYKVVTTEDENVVLHLIGKSAHLCYL